MMKKRSVAVCLLAAGLLSSCATTGEADVSAATPTATVTVTETVTPEPASGDEDAYEETSSETAEIRPADFKIKLKIREKSCFGSAGCNVVFQIDPKYVGYGDIMTGSYDVTYKVVGGDDGPMINTFTIDDGQASFDEEEIISTPSQSAKLTAKVTDVSSRGW